MKSATTYLMIAGAVIAAASCDDDDNNNTPSQPAQTPRVVEQTNIVSDQGAAMATDPKLVNAWGLAFNPIGAAWVSATETGVSAVFDANGNALIPAVSIPAPSGAAEDSAPTGQVFNDDTSTFQGDLFIFVTEKGTVAGWQQSNGTEAVQRVDNSGSEAVYKGVTIAKNASGGPKLLAADFHGAKIDVFDSTYAPVNSDTAFRDPNIPAGFAPFNVETVGDTIIVTYALQDDDKEDDVKGAGNGYVDLYDAQGTFMARLISQGELDSPWGVAMAPQSFAAAPGKLLIGNFGDGRIHVYNADVSGGSNASAQLEGTLRNPNGSDIVIDGLWALKFGVDAGGFSSSQLYFTAGPADETHGTFGALDAAAGAADGGTDGGATGGAAGAPTDGGGVPSGTGGATGAGGSTGTGGGSVSSPPPSGPYMR